jgi:hypothetical protein
MVEPVRVLPEEARNRVLAREAILVCAYDDEEKFRKAHLEGAISLQEFRARAETLPKEQEVIFY